MEKALVEWLAMYDSRTDSTIENKRHTPAYVKMGRSTPLSKAEVLSRNINHPNSLLTYSRECAPNAEVPQTLRSILCNDTPESFNDAVIDTEARGLHDFCC